VSRRTRFKVKGGVDEGDGSSYKRKGLAGTRDIRKTDRKPMIRKQEGARSPRSNRCLRGSHRARIVGKKIGRKERFFHSAIYTKDEKC